MPSPPTKIGPLAAVLLPVYGGNISREWGTLIVSVKGGGEHCVCGERER